MDKVDGSGSYKDKSQYGRVTSNTPALIEEMRNKNWEAMGHHTSFVKAVIPSRQVYDKQKREAHSDERKQKIKDNHPLLTTHVGKYDIPTKQNPHIQTGIFKKVADEETALDDFESARLAVDIDPNAKSRHMSALMKMRTEFAPTGFDGSSAGSSSSKTSSSDSLGARSGSSNWTEEEWVPLEDPNGNNGSKRNKATGGWMTHPFMKRRSP